MKLNGDGTITVEFPSMRAREDGTWEQNGESTVTLRRPLLDEVFLLWEELDRLGEEMPVTAETPNRQSTILRRNAEWSRYAIRTLATETVYVPFEGEEGTTGGLRPREGLAEPGWMSSPTVAAEWLKHWQTVPLAPGASTPSPA